MLWGIGKNIYRTLFPAPPPPPTVAFDKLPKLPFPEKKNLPKLEYKVETPEGELPVLPSQIIVYFMPKLSVHLLSLDIAREKAVKLGFSPESQEISATVYRFFHSKTSAILEMNIVSGIFSISYNLPTDFALSQGQPPSPEIAASRVRSFLSSANLLPEDLTGITTHQFLKVESQNLVDAISLSEADLIKINLFRKSYNQLPSLTPKPNEANIWFIASGVRQREKQIIAAQFHYFPVDESQSATYPIKTSQEALDKLVADKGYIANLGLNEDGKITIRKIYLAYYDSGVRTEFYQPIIVFEGDHGFTAYVPAVTDDYYGE